MYSLRFSITAQDVAFPTGSGGSWRESDAVRIFSLLRQRGALPKCPDRHHGGRPDQEIGTNREGGDNIQGQKEQLGAAAPRVHGSREMPSDPKQPRKQWRVQQRGELMMMMMMTMTMTMSMTTMTMVMVIMMVIAGDGDSDDDVDDVDDGGGGDDDGFDDDDPSLHSTWTGPTANLR